MFYFAPVQRTCLQSGRTILNGTRPQLTADDIGVRQALEIFELKRAFEWDAWKLKDEQLFDVPDLLGETLHSSISPSV